MWRFAQSTPLAEKLRVVCAGAHFPAGYHYLQQVLEERNLCDTIEVLRAPTWDSLMTIAPTVHAAIPFMEGFSADFIKAASPQLRLIQQFGVGVEGIDLTTATQEGVAVCNVPANANTANAQATAEHALLLTLMLLRSAHDELPHRFHNQILGGWPLPRTLYGQRVTVVGFGAVGSQLCQYLLALGAQVTAVRRNWPQVMPTTSATAENEVPNQLIQQSTNLDAELPATNVLILCCTMTPKTHHLVNQHRLSLLPKDGKSLVVNVGRGHLIDYDAIRQALDEGRVAGFASDVGVGHASKPSEPWDPQDPLSVHPKTIFTPHVGGNCVIVVRRMAEIIVTNLERIRLGQPPLYWVNQTGTP